MKVYGVPVSPFVRKVLIALQLKGLSYELDPVSPGCSDHEEFVAISPLRKVPAFRDNDLALADSTVICEYLEAQYPAIAIYPIDIKNRAKARWLEEYMDTKGIEVYGAGLFFERVAKPALLGQPSNEELISTTISEKIPPVQDYLESQMPEQGFLFGDLCIADVAIACVLLNAKYVNHSVDHTRWPKLASYLQRVWQHKVFVAQLEQEKPMMDEVLIKAGVLTG